MEPGDPDSNHVSRPVLLWMVCPLGAIHHFFGNLKSERKRGKQMIELNRYQRWQTTKYYLLFALFVATLFGTAMVARARAYRHMLLRSQIIGLKKIKFFTNETGLTEIDSSDSK